MKEMVGKREAQVVQYQVQNKEFGDLAELSVWQIAWASISSAWGRLPKYARRSRPRQFLKARSALRLADCYRFVTQAKDSGWVTHNGVGWPSRPGRAAGSRRTGTRCRAMRMPLVALRICVHPRLSVALSFLKAAAWRGLSGVRAYPQCKRFISFPLARILSGDLRKSEKSADNFSFF